MQSSDDKAIPNTGQLSRTVQDWDAVRIFLQVARLGSFRAAAQTLDQSVNALRHHVSELEKQLGVALLTRHVDGVRATPEGNQVLAAALQMESASFGLVRASEQVNSDVCGEVRLAVTEGLGTFWLAPRLVEFQRAFPKLLIDVFCAMQSADVLRMEADVSVQLTRPNNLDLKVVRIGRLHVMPFAAQSYLDIHGSPKSVSDLLNHRMVLQVAEHLTSQADYDRLFPGVPQAGFVALRTNVSSAHYWSIAKGAGIGVLPTYAIALGAPLVPLDIGVRLPIDVWLAYHPDSNRIPRVRRLLDWIIEAFDSRKFPWFGDEFVHPKDFPAGIEGEALVNMFAGFGAFPKV